MIGFMSEKLLGIWQRRGWFWRWFWRRVSVNLLLGWAMSGVLVGINQTYTVVEHRNLFVYAAGLLAVVAVLSMHGPEPTRSARLRPSGMLLVFLVESVLLLGISYGEKRDSAFLVVNSGLMAVAVPFLAVVLRLLPRHPLLMVGVVVPFPVLVLLAWLLWVPEELAQDFPTLSVVMAAVPLFCWALFLLGVIRLARWGRGKPVWGALTEVMLMVFLFAPLIAGSVLVPILFKWGERWLSVSILLVGLLLSNVVSVPLRHLMLDLGGLSSGVVDDGGGEGNP